MAKFDDLYAQLDAALEAARTDNTYEATVAVKEARKALSDAIAKGAVDCPDCKVPPMGLRQPYGPSRVEFEIGCPICPRKARGGVLARHAVELWNEQVES